MQTTQVCSTKLMALLVLAGTIAFPHRSYATTLPDACGDDKTTFDVKPEKDQPPPAPPDAGGAQIVFMEEFDPGPGVCISCEVTTRIGVDGKWVGANHGNSYFAYAVSPGAHHLCADWQSTQDRLRKKIGVASLNAEAELPAVARSRWHIPSQSVRFPHAPTHRPGCPILEFPQVFAWTRSSYVNV